MGNSSMRGKYESIADRDVHRRFWGQSQSPGIPSLGTVIEEVLLKE